MNVQKGCKMPTLQCGDNIIGLKTGKMLWASYIMPCLTILLNCSKRRSQKYPEEIPLFQGLSRNILDYLGLYGTIWDNLGQAGTIWDKMGLSGPNWTYLGLSEIL